MEEIILKGIIDEECDDEITYCCELRQIKGFKWCDFNYGADFLYVTIKKEGILDDIEKEYLSAVIKPFRDKVEYIKKNHSNFGEYITICVIDEFINFPCFKENEMYKNMEIDERYSLEELGL